MAAALDLLTRHGIEGMSLRKVAAALETGPASLYAYVDDLRALQTLVLDRVLGDVSVPEKSELDWRGRLASLLQSYITVLASRPGLAQLAMNTIAAGPNALRIMEALLDVLDEGGVDQATAAWAVDLISLYATAIAAEQSLRKKEHGDPFGPLVRMLGMVSQQEFPRIHAAREELVAGEGLQRFDWAIQVLLKGVLQTPRSPLAAPGTSTTRQRSPRRTKRA